MNISYSRFAILKFHSVGGCAGRFVRFAAGALVFASTLLLSQSAGTGSIVGLVTDPQGKVLADAKVEIRNPATAARIHVTTSSAGVYSSGPIQPGNYVVRVGGKGFKTAELPLEVRSGGTVNGNVQMQAGAETVVAVVRNETTVNVDQATVQGVLTGEQGERLPIDGRNFLDLAQLQPGIQMQDGERFEAKDGLTSISFLGQFGRSERISVDGVDVSDETVGTTTQNIPLSASPGISDCPVVARCLNRGDFVWRGECDDAHGQRSHSWRRIWRVPRGSGSGYAAGFDGVFVSAGTVWWECGWRDHQE